VSDDTFKGLVIVVVLGLLALGFGAGVVVEWLTVEHTEIQVLRVEREVKGKGDSVKAKYMVTTENEVFENTDTIAFWKYNSSDVQRELLPGGRYKVKVNGWRWPWASWYRNIIEVEETLSKPTQVDQDLKAKILALVDVEALSDTAFRNEVRKLVKE